MAAVRSALSRRRNDRRQKQHNDHVHRPLQRSLGSLLWNDPKRDPLWRQRVRRRDNDVSAGEGNLKTGRYSCRTGRVAVGSSIPELPLSGGVRKARTVEGRILAASTSCNRPTRISDAAL